jgi:uncharacterized protein (UPF0332 family)
MKLDPYSFLEIARDISVDTEYCYETGYRTCINRAYYAAHLISKQYLESKGCKFTRDRSVHKQVIDELAKRNQYARDLLYDLKNKRTDADYNMNITIYETSVSESIETADEIVNEINQLKNQ